MELRRAVVLICVLLAGCTGKFENSSCELIPGTEKADASDAVSVSPDGRWLVFREYDPVSKRYAVASLDLQTNAVTLHHLPDGSYLKDNGKRPQDFRGLSFSRVAWKDSLFWGINETDEAGHPVVLDPQDAELRFNETKNTPRLRDLSALDRPNDDALRDWLARNRHGCSDGNEPAHINAVGQYDWSIPMPDGQLADAFYLSDGREVVRIDPGCDRTVVSRVTQSAINSKSIYLVAVTTDERFLAFGEAAMNRFAPLGGHTGDEVRIVDLRTGERKLVMRAARVGSLIWLDDGHTLVFNAEGQRSGLFRIDAQQLFD